MKKIYDCAGCESEIFEREIGISIDSETVFCELCFENGKRTLEEWSAMDENEYDGYGADMYESYADVREVLK